MDEIKLQLVELIKAVEGEIYSLNDDMQSQIFDSNINPDDKWLRLLEHCYTQANKLLMEINSLPS